MTAWNHIFLDMESRSSVPIKLTGAYKYARGRDTEILCIAWVLGDNDIIELWTKDSAPSAALMELARNPNIMFSAYNVGFERRMWHFVLHKKLGWPDIPIERWHDVQADAYAMGFPGDLKRCAKAVGAEHTKDASGTRLINLISKPIVGTEPPRFRRKLDIYDDYMEMYEYCKQDVRSTRSIHNALTEHTTLDNAQERAIWALTERMNDKGVPIDSTLVKSIWAHADEKTIIAQEKLSILTEGRVASGTQLKLMNAELDYPLRNFQKSTITEALACPLMSDHDREIINARLTFANTSVAKFDKMMYSECSDGTCKDLLQYHGAATGRYAGRGIQIQNYPRRQAKNPDELAAVLIDPHLPLHMLESYYGDVMDLAVSMLRSSIYAPVGYEFICRDYSSIEAKGTAWGVKDEDQLDAFREGRDIYKFTAADMYDILYEAVTGVQRQAGKIAVLACGYQGGWKALRDFARGYGIHWTNKEAFMIVTDFRDARPKLVAAWRAFEDSAVAAIRNPGRRYQVKGCQHAVFCMYGRHLSLELPSMKKIWFPHAEIREIRLKYETWDGKLKVLERDGITHMWMNNNIWIRRSIHGGSLFQSWVQAVCRELLMEAQLRIDADGWDLRMSIHDELTAMEKTGKRNPDDFEKLMNVVPDWAEGMPITSSGWEGRRFRK